MIHLSTLSLNVQRQPMFKLFEKVLKLERSGLNIIHLESDEHNFYTPLDTVKATFQEIKCRHKYYAISMEIYGLSEVVLN